MIEVKNLTKKYGDHLAIEDISFRLEPGKIYGFLGPNGAGKSTTMNIMTGYLAADSGEVLINGHSISEEPEEAKAVIGYLPEIPPLYSDMTVEEYITFAARLKKVKKADIKSAVDEVIERTGLGEYRRRLVANLSKGYKQRTGLAQALIGKPQIIILDEPTVGLDPAQIIEIRDLIKTLGRDHTVILSSHILSEISAVCDHLLIIARGHLIASDTPAGLIRQYSEKPKLGLTVKGSLGEVDSVLSSVENITAVQTGPSYTEEECIEAQIEAPMGVDVREDVFKAFAQAGLPVLEMRYYRPSLEDIFLRLTRDEEEKAIRREEEEYRRRYSGRNVSGEEEVDE